VNVKANRGRRKKAGAGGARVNAGRKKAAESAGGALAVINQPATPAVAKKIKSKRMNFDSPDNQELVNEAIQGFRNKRGRFWQPGLSARSRGRDPYRDSSQAHWPAKRGRKGALNEEETEVLVESMQVFCGCGV
jgi:hypothetical protein